MKEGEGEGKGKRYAGYVSNRELKIRGWRRQQNRPRKSEFAFFQSSSRLLQVTNFVKCRWTLLKLNSYEPYPTSERERKFHRRLCTSPVKREIRHFHGVVVHWGQRKVQKSVMWKVVVLVIKPIAFLTFSLPWPSSDLKNSDESPRWQMLHTMIQMALSELVMLLKFGVLWWKLNIINAIFFPFITERILANF